MKIDLRVHRHSQQPAAKLPIAELVLSYKNEIWKLESRLELMAGTIPPFPKCGVTGMKHWLMHYDGDYYERH